MPPDAGVAVAGTSPRADVINSVEAQPASTWSNASASRWSTVSPYRCRTATTRAANQQRFCAGGRPGTSDDDDDDATPRKSH